MNRRSFFGVLGGAAGVLALPGSAPGRLIDAGSAAQPLCTCPNDFTRGHPDVYRCNCDPLGHTMAAKNKYDWNCPVHGTAAARVRCQPIEFEMRRLLRPYYSWLESDERANARLAGPISFDDQMTVRAQPHEAVWIGSDFAVAYIEAHRERRLVATTRPKVIERLHEGFMWLASYRYGETA